GAAGARTRLRRSQRADRSLRFAAFRPHAWRAGAAAADRDARAACVRAAIPLRAVSGGWNAALYQSRAGHDPAACTLWRPTRTGGADPAIGVVTIHANLHIMIA